MGKCLYRTRRINCLYKIFNARLHLTQDKSQDRSQTQMNLSRGKINSEIRYYITCSHSTLSILLSIFAVSLPCALLILVDVSFFQKFFQNNCNKVSVSHIKTILNFTCRQKNVHCVLF